jgi:hypothetical protein
MAATPVCRLLVFSMAFVCGARRPTWRRVEKAIVGIRDYGGKRRTN